MGGKNKKQTNNMLGLIQAQEGELCNIAFPMCICRLTLAWISREISTKLLGMPTHLDRSSPTGPYLTPTGISGVRCRLATRVTLRQLPSVIPFVQFSLAFLYPLPVTSRSQAQGFDWFRTKIDKGMSAKRTTYIVLQNFHQVNSMWVRNTGSFKYLV